MDTISELNRGLIKKVVDRKEELIKDAITYMGVSLSNLPDISNRGIFVINGEGDTIFNFDGVDLLLFKKPEYKMDGANSSITQEFKKLY